MYTGGVGRIQTDGQFKGARACGTGQKNLRRQQLEARAGGEYDAFGYLDWDRKLVEGRRREEEGVDVGWALEERSGQ